MNEKLNKILNSIDSINKFDSLNKINDRRLEVMALKMNGDLLAQKISPLKSALDYVPKLFASTNFDNLLTIQAQNNEILRKVVFAGETTSNFTKYTSVYKPLDALIKIDQYKTKWKDVTTSIGGDLTAFNTHVSLINDVSKIFSNELLKVDASLRFEKFTKDLNYTNPNYLDILSASTFVDINKVYDTKNKTNSFIEECAVIKSELSRNSDLVKEALEFTKATIQSTGKGYIELSDRFIIFLVDKLGWSKQRAYHLFLLLLITLGTGKEIAIESLMQGTNMNVQNKYYINPKTNSQDVIIKDAPIYSKRLSSTRKIGTYKKFTIVEIIKVKEGWCFVKGETNTRTKKQVNSSKKDTIVSGWIKQRYLKNYKD